VQAAITVIADESDSAVAATARQTLNTIVSRVAAQISLQKISGFQQSVGAASLRLQAYSSQQLNLYGLIASRTAPAESELMKARELTDDNAKNLIASLQLPTLLFPAVSSHDTANASNTFVSVPPGSAATKAQIAILQQSSRLISQASGNVRMATILARQADKQAQSLQDYEIYNKDFLQPVRSIQVFAGYQANSILRPLVYEEKPAYGTGKRPIDFLIASIIALTIFQGAVMGMGRAVAGEKREGSLTRVFLTPTSTATIIIGTLLFYIIFELFRSAFIITVAILFFNINIEGSLLAIALILAIYAGVSTGIGMILSSAVKTEQQYMAMSMLVSMPTLFLAGVFFPLQAMPKALQVLAAFLPVTYAGEALRGAMIKGFSISLIAYPLFILFVFLAVIVGIVFLVFKRDIE
jgi:ABC-type multidrug transport system permease subunit